MSSSDMSKPSDELRVTDAIVRSDHVTTNDIDAWKAGKQEWLIILCLCIVSLVVALDATILVPALPTIASALGASTLSTYWIGTSYLLIITVASFTFFTIGSIIACVAQKVPQMLAGRVLQGVGGGGVVVMTQLIITDIVPLRQRPRYLSIPQMSWAIGTVSGPLIGGAFAQNATWRWIFYLNFPFCAIGLAMVPLVVKYRRPSREALESFIAVDWIGCVLFTAGIVSFLMAVSWGGVQYPWSSYQTLVPLIVGVFVIAMSLFWESRFAKHPFIRLAIYQNWSSVGAIICTILQGFLLYLGLYYISFYFLSVRRRSPVETGVAFLPLTLALLPTSAVTGVLVTRTGRFQTMVWLGWSIITLANGLLILLGTSTKTVAWVFIFIVAGIGQGIIVTALNIAMQATVESEYVSDASALYTFLRSLGMALGVGIGGAAFQNRLSHQLALAGLPISISTDAEGFIQFLHGLPDSNREWVAGVLGAFAEAFRNLFELSTAVAALGLLASLLVRDQDLDKVRVTRHVLRRGGRGGSVDEEEVVELEEDGESKR